ncbi:hypothetical protein [Kineococcus arenarius]|uniref:hypothetical protein n=1 Tax=unclassified Kineococcus TaxID=2621656 RepID=UPI003D7C9203
MDGGFEDLLHDAVRTVWVLGVPTLGPDVLRVRDDDLCFEFALPALRRAVAGLPRRRALEQLRHRFAAADATARGSGSLQVGDAADWRLRIGPAWEEGEAAAAVVSLPLPEGFEAFVVRPGEHGELLHLPTAAAEQLGGRRAALGAALTRTITGELVGVRVEDHHDARHLLRRVSLPGNPFVTAVLLSLPRFLPAGTTAALVAAPGCDEVLLAPLTGDRDGELTDLVRRLAQQRFAGSALPCTPHPHRWDGRRFHPA